MSDWKPVIQSGDRVDTPHGTGTVRRISHVNATAQVDVDGQLFEIPMTELKQGGKPSEQEPKPTERRAKSVSPKRVKEGDRVRKKDSEATGTVKEVTQRTVRVKWDSDNSVTAHKKKTIYQDLEQHNDKQETEQKSEQKQEQKSEQTPVDKATDGLYDLMQLKQKLEQKIDTDVDGELKELREMVKKTQKLEVKVGDKVNVIQGLKHKQLEQLITYAMLRLNPLLVGMAGTGKTHAGEQVAEALNLPFYSMSVGAQTSKSDLVGYTSASGDYVKVHFREAYENGGVFLMDEIDAGNANVLIQVNSALSNGYMAFPDAMVKKHEDFVFIASANTYGNGANRQYVGRNQLDAATLDRFAVIDWYIDDELESNLTVGLNGKAWYMAVRACRDYVAEKNIRALISPRATQKGSRLLDVGQPLDEVINATLLASVPEDKRPDVTQVATEIFEKFASEVPKNLPTEVDPPDVRDLVKDIQADVSEV